MQPPKLGRWCTVAQKHSTLTMAQRRAAFSGNTSLIIATFSSLFYFIVNERAAFLTKTLLINFLLGYKTVTSLTCDAWCLVMG